MRKREEGSTSLTVIAAVTSLFLAGMYVQSSSTQINQTAKRIVLDETQEAARTNNLSNLSVIRSMLNPSKVSASLFEPAIYPSNYFESDWSLKKNDARPVTGLSVQGNAFKLKTFSSDLLPISKAAPYFASDNPRSQLNDLQANKELKILRLNPDPTHRYYIRSVDVQAKNLIGSDSKNKVDTIGRIQLVPPEPGPVTLYIAPAGSNVWSTNYGTAASPLPPGKYKLQLRASGVVLYGEITRSTGGSMLLGMDEKGITHKANNIHAVDEILGETIDVELGFDKKESITRNVEAEENSELSSHTTHNADCSFTITPTGAVTPPVTGSPSGSAGTAVTVASSPAEIKLGIKIYRVDGEESERSFEQSVFVTSTTTTTTITQTIPGTTTANGGAQCGNRCPIDRESIFADYVNFLDRSYRDNADKTKVDVRRAHESDGLPAPGGAICSNFELVAQDLVDGMGGVAPNDINKQPNPQKLWDIFDDRVKIGMTSMHYERFYAYIAPACGREMLGTRNGCGCFAADTRIRMGDGSERMASDIRQGDLLWNPMTKKAQAVRNVVVGPETALLYHLTIGGRNLEVTVDHPFLTKDGLKPAHKLMLGDIIVDAGHESPVERIEREDREIGAKAPEVWNFELEGSTDPKDHYVLANGVMTGDLYLQIQLKNSGESP